MRGDAGAHACPRGGSPNREKRSAKIKNTPTNRKDPMVNREGKKKQFCVGPKGGGASRKGFSPKGDV